MITVSITAYGATVAEALANVRAIAQDSPAPGSIRERELILDGMAREVRKGGNKIGSLQAEADTDAEKLAHYTKADRNNTRLCHKLGCAAARVASDGWCDTHRPETMPPISVAEANAEVHAMIERRDRDEQDRPASGPANPRFYNR